MLRGAIVRNSLVGLVGLVGLVALAVVAPARVARAQQGPPTAEPTVVIHLDSPRAVRLERRAPGDASWQTVCSAPCDMMVVASGDFRVAGDDVPAGSPFAVRGAQGERVNVTVHPSSRTVRTTSAVVAAIGGGVAVVASVTAIVELLVAGAQGMSAAGCAWGSAATLSSAAGCPKPSQPNTTPLWAAAGVGALAGVVGVALLLANGSTTATGSNIDSGGAPPPSPPPMPEPTPPDDVAPAFVSTSMVLPVLQGTF